MKLFTLVDSLALAVLAVVGLVASSAASPLSLAPPDEPGPFNVGTAKFSAMMSDGRVTQIRVFYPTGEAADDQTQYTIQTPVGTYQLDSPLWAVEGAQALPGQFPLVVHDHGGGAAGRDRESVAQLAVHELMASHGIVTAVALHSANPIDRVRDLPLVIDAMLDRSADDGDPLFDAIDPARIGISGMSAGGAAAIGAAGGVAASAIAPDPRIKALALYEPGRPNISYSLLDASTIAVPYLIMGGTQHASGPATATLFDATVLATPRIRVSNPGATHFSYNANLEAEIDQAREQALLANPDMPEPLTTLSASNAAAARAYEIWNWGEILFPILGPGAGSGRNFADRVGVNSVRSLDLDQDGFTDSPPFMATDAFVLEPTIRAEVMVPMLKLYTVAFWKTFLEGDRRYMGYLTPGYANRSDLQAMVDIEVPEPASTLLLVLGAAAGCWRGRRIVSRAPLIR
jgi:predicted dienelactone hydrolase